VGTADEQRFCRTCQDTEITRPQQQPGQEVERESADTAVKRHPGLFVQGVEGRLEEGKKVEVGKKKRSRVCKLSCWKRIREWWGSRKTRKSKDVELRQGRRILVEVEA
jgi:hypothetical protein